MTNGREHLLDWLRDAHAMEQAAIDILERQESRIESYPDMQRKVREHLETTRRQADRLEETISSLDGDTSLLKQSAARLMGNMSVLMNAAASDEIIKNAIADYTFEQFEIASYRALIAAAEELGETHVAQTCRENLREEEEMASWLENQLPEITRQFLEREHAEVSSKR
jgi:ferritin-like metal-binding protein YciE